MVSKTVKNIARTVLLLSLLAVSLSSLGQLHFTENSPTDPAKRKTVQFAEEILGFFSQQGSSLRLADTSFEESGKVYRILPTPAILSPAELKEMQEGTAELNELIRRLLRDHYSGEKSYKKVMVGDEDLLDQIEKRQGVNRSLVDIDDIQMLQGPDLLRGSDGHFYMLEINSFMASGVPASELNVKLMDRYFPGIKTKTENPKPFTSQVAEEFNRQAQEIAGSGAKAVVIRYHLPQFPRFLIGGKWHGVAKSYRKMMRQQQKIFAQHGIELVTVNPLRPYGGKDSFDGSKKVIGWSKKDGLTLTITRGGKKETHKVGFLYSEIVPKHLRWMMPHAIRAYKDKRVRLSHTPGIEILDDKRILKHLPALAAHYGLPEMKFKVPETLTFAKQDGSLNEESLKKLLANIKKYVVKGPDGQGGSSVYIGKDLSDEDIKKVEAMIRKEPRTFEAQEFIAASRIKVKNTMDGEREYMLDFRPLTFLTSRLKQVAGKAKQVATSIVTSTPWSRAIASDAKDSRMNVSATADAGGAGNVVVLVAKQETGPIYLCIQAAQ